jgi:hypothetical protein
MTNEGADRRWRCGAFAGEVEASRRGWSSERLAQGFHVVTSSGANKLCELCGARESPLGNNHRRQSVGVDVGVRRGRDHSFHGPPGGGGLLRLARTGHALGGNGDAVRTEQSPILSLAHHPGDILAESAAIRPGEVEQVSGHEAEQGEQIEECPPRTAPVVCQIPNATANEEPDESGKQPRAPVVPSGGGRVKMVIEIERGDKGPVPLSVSLYLYVLASLASLARVDSSARNGFAPRTPRTPRTPRLEKAITELPLIIRVGGRLGGGGFRAQ